MACVSVPDAAHTSPSSSPSPQALLRLTPEIRLRLYRYLGLASWNGCPYRFDLNGKRAGCETWPGFRPDPIEFHGLLICCRTIYTEAAPLLYSANSFVVHYHAFFPLTGFHSLGALTEAPLRSLSQLKIVVNEATYHNKVANDDYAGSYCHQGRDEHDWSDWVWCRDYHGDIHQTPFLSDYASLEEEEEDHDGARRAWHSAAACSIDFRSVRAPCASMRRAISSHRVLALASQDSSANTI